MKKIDSTYEAHTKIGWNNFLKGRLSTQWGDIMQDHYDKFHSSNCTHSRERFQTTLIAGLWKTYDSLWKLRSALLHDPRDLSSLSNIELNKRTAGTTPNHDISSAQSTNTFSPQTLPSSSIGQQHRNVVGCRNSTIDLPCTARTMMISCAMSLHFTHSSTPDHLYDIHIPLQRFNACIRIYQ